MSLDIYFYKKEEEDCVYSTNITHNCGDMADAAGLYYPLWRPESLNIDNTDQLLNYLTDGIGMYLKNRPEIEKLEAKNGWGTYEQFYNFLSELMLACSEYKDCLIRISR